MPDELSVGTFLILPGFMNSGPTHWQTLWQADHQRFRRLEHSSWDLPDPAVWLHELSHAVGEFQPPIILIAHSLACVNVAAWAKYNTGRVAAALLVAPADVEDPSAPAAVRSFAPISRLPLGLPSLVIASRNDPYGKLPRIQALASAWGSQLVDLGESGHINVDAGFGPWPEGKQFLVTLVSQVGLRWE